MKLAAHLFDSTLLPRNPALKGHDFSRPAKPWKSTWAWQAARKLHFELALCQSSTGFAYPRHTKHRVSHLGAGALSGRGTGSGFSSQGGQARTLQASFVFCDMQ